MRQLFGFLLALSLVALTVVLGYYALERRNEIRTARSEEAVADHAEEVFRSPRSVVAGNPQGDVSIVAFSDYNCPDCRQNAPGLAKLLAEDSNIRLVLKELPVLGPDSEDTARVVLAAKRQGKAYALYQSLIAARGRVTKARALAIAGELGLDTARLERDMNDPAVTAALIANRRLADDLGVRGVPFYLVGDRVLPEGSKDVYGDLKDRVADVRANGCQAAC